MRGTELYQYCFEQLRVSVKFGLRACEDALGASVGNFHHYLLQLERDNPPHTCQSSWKNRQLTGKCYDCRQEKNSCICLYCFWKGKHKNHRSYLQWSSSGNCDCGDCRFWKHEGFCPDHPGPDAEPDVIQLCEKFREAARPVIRAVWDQTFIFLAAGRAGDEAANETCKWLRTLTGTCDGMRRVTAKAICDSDIPSMFAGLRSMTSDGAKVLFDVIGSLLNDAFFSVNFAEKFLQHYIPLLDANLTDASTGFVDPDDPPFAGPDVAMRHAFHFMAPATVKVLIEGDRVDWTGIWCAALESQVKALLGNISINAFYGASEALTDHWAMCQLYKVAVKIPRLAERYDAFLVDIAKILVRLEGALTTKRLPLHTVDPGNYIGVRTYFWASLGSHLAKMSYKAGRFNRPLYDVYVNWLKEFVVSGRFDNAKTKVPIYHRVVFGEHAKTTIDCGLAVFASESLRASPSPREDLMRVCEDHHFDYDEFCLYAALLPLRYLAACYLANSTKLYDSAEASPFRSAARSTLESFYNLRGIFMELFSLVQCYFGLCRNKDMFLEMVLHTFGYYEKGLQADIAERIETDCLLFVAALITDRRCATGDAVAMALHQIMCLVKGDPNVSVDTIERSTRPFGPGTDETANVMKDVLEREEDRLVFTDESKWHIVMPFGSRKEWYHTMNLLMEKQPDYVQNFPEFEPFGKYPDCDLESALHSKTLFAMLYDVLYNSLTRSTPAVQLAAGLLTICAKRCTGRAPDHHMGMIVADSITTLSAEISDNFQEFIRTPVLYKFGFPNSVVQILSKLGSFGKSVLSQAEITTVEGSMKIKPDVAAIKQKIMSEYEASVAAFEDACAKSRNHKLCSVCGENSPDSPLVGYPVLTFLSIVPEMAARGKDPNTTLIQPCNILYGCAHPIHLKCAPQQCRSTSDLFHTFSCPYCHAARTTLLPVLSDDLREKDNDLLCQMHRRAMDALDKDAPARGYADILTNHVINLEVRYRNRPEVLNSESTRKIYRQLFLNILLRSVKKSVAKAQSEGLEKTIHYALTKLVKRYNENPDKAPSIKWKSVISHTKMPSDPVQKVIMARQVVIFCYFMLGLDVPVEDGVLDWDEIMRPESLAKRFKFKLSGPVQVPMFGPIAMPDDWIDLAFPPYELPIVDMDKVRSKCVVTGADMLGFRRRPGENGMIVRDFLARVFNGGLALVMVLSGIEATKIVAGSIRYNRFLTTKAVWVDRSGADDYGLQRGEYLMLDRENLCQVWDDFLSGKLHDTLPVDG